MTLSLARHLLRKSYVLCVVCVDGKDGVRALVL